MKTLRGREAHAGNHPNTCFWPENFSIARSRCVLFPVKLLFQRLSNQHCSRCSFAGAHVPDTITHNHGWLWQEPPRVEGQGDCAPSSPLGQEDMVTPCLCCLWDLDPALSGWHLLHLSASITVTWKSQRESKRKSCVSSKYCFIPVGFSSCFALGCPLRLGPCCMDVVNRKWKFLWGLCKSPDTDSGM